MDLVRDLARFPELRFLDRHYHLVPLALVGGLYGLGRVLESRAPGLGTSGGQMLVWGFFVSTVALFHGTYLINSLAHRWGRRRYATRDESRNNALLSAITLGEGWHNNHHRCPSAARHGFRRGELDPTWLGLKVLERLRFGPAPGSPGRAGRRGGRTMKVAIVGAGISGLTVAWLLHRDHEITVFEAGDHPGGHAHTVDVDENGRRLAVDTGFVVFNTWNYPNFTRLLELLGVESRPSDMSFSVHHQASGTEYRGSSLNTLFAQRRNLVRPSFHRMVGDILRFYREAPALLRNGVPGPSLGEYVRSGATPGSSWSGT